MRAAAARICSIAQPFGRVLGAPVLYSDVVWVALGLISASWLWRGMQSGSAWPGTVSVLCVVAVVVDLLRAPSRRPGQFSGPLAVLLILSPAVAGGISIAAAILVGAIFIGIAAKAADDNCLVAAALMLTVIALQEFFSGFGVHAVGQVLLESEALLLGKMLTVAGEPARVLGSVLHFPDRQVLLLTECSSLLLIAEAAVLTLAIGRLLRVEPAKLAAVLFLCTAFTALLNLGRLMAMLLSPALYGQLHNEPANQALGFVICGTILALLFPLRGRGV